jgi:cytochrome c oxidase assembly factor CtaG
VQSRRIVGAAAVVAFAFAVALDPWADHSLVVHMSEHLILMVIVAPLVVIAWPLSHVSRTPHSVSFAAGAVAAETLALAVWHLPGPFLTADAHPPLHMLEHASFLATAVAVWWVVLVAPMSIGVRFATLVASSAPMLLLGVWMTLAPSPWYHTSIVDQQVAGALMWGPASLPAVVAAAWLVGSVVLNDELKDELKHEQNRFAAGSSRGDAAL